MRFRDLRTRWESLRRRRLAFEALERRDLLAVMRIVDWNTLNGPDNATEDANFQTVLQAIGTESVQGNTQRVDILALEETDTPAAGNDSIDRIKSVLNTLYSTNTYLSVYTTIDNGGDATGFVYDTSTVSLLESVQVGTGTLTHNVMRGKFQPVGAPASSIFYAYSIHLKSGDTGADATTRGTEAAFIRSNADALGDGTQVLFMGDFNMKTSTEAAYSNFVAAGNAQLQDVADAPGDWNDNPAFLSLHSQDPRVAMDDRFDIQFASGEFYDGIGVDYVPDSFHIFGNNGTHTLNQPITTGTGASPAVLNALVAASDHLPAVGDYQVLAVTPSVRITETLGSTKVVEGGLYDTYQAVLTTMPTSNVTVTVTPNSQVDVGNGAGVAKVLTFTPANALTPQTVIVHAVDDAASEGNHTGLISHSSSSSDANYNGLSIANVNVSIVDNDAPTIVINEMDADQASPDSAEFVELYDGGVGNFPLDGYLLVFFNGSDANNGSYKSVNLTGKHTNASGFFVLGDSGMTPAPDMAFPGGATNQIQQGPDGIGLYKYTTAELMSNPNPFPNGTSPTQSHLQDAIVYTTAAGGAGVDQDLIDALNPGQAQVNENQHELSDTQSLSRVPDDGSPFNSAAYVAQTPTPGTFNQAQPYGVLVLQSNARVDVAEGGATDSYQLALLSIPTSNVQITVDPDNQTSLGGGAGVPIVLTFTPANALIPQTITVTAVDDGNVEGDHTSLITHSVASSDAKYNGFTIPDVVANITDNDFPVPPSIVISELMYDPTSESGPVGEWIEVVNTGTQATDLGGWKFDDEDATNWGPIPANTVLQPNQVAVFYDTAFASAATFRTEWAVPANALVLGVTWGSLGDSPSAVPPLNEVLKLLDNVGVQRDLVNYDDTGPWPTDSKGHSIYLTNLSADNNVGSNWAKSVTGTAKALSASGPTYATSDVGSPGRFFLGGDYSTNGSVDIADYVMWRKTQNQSVLTGTGADGSGATFGVPDGTVNQFDYVYWRANFGSTGALSTPPLGGSNLAATSSLNQPAAADVSEPEQTAVMKSESTVDTAITQLNPVMAAPAAKASSGAVVRSGLSASSNSSSDELLLALRPATLSQTVGIGSDMHTYVAEQDTAATDELFASIDGVAKELGLSAALL